MPDAGTTVATTTTTADAAAPGANPYETENDRVVKEAFGGTPPNTPQLSRDGDVAAVNLNAPIGLSDSSTYEIGFLRRTGKRESIAVIDRALATKMLHDFDPTTLDRAALSRAATAITARLTDGGFTPFATAIDYDAIYKQVDDAGAVALGAGAGKLEVKDDGKLSVRLVDASGAARKSEVFKPLRAGTKAGGNCGGEPHLRAVWVDATRKRALLAITYTTGGDMCDEVAGTYRLWSL